MDLIKGIMLIGLIGVAAVLGMRIYDDTHPVSNPLLDNMKEEAAKILDSIVNKREEPDQNRDKAASEPKEETANPKIKKSSSENRDAKTQPPSEKLQGSKRIAQEENKDPTQKNLQASGPLDEEDKVLTKIALRQKPEEDLSEAMKEAAETRGNKKINDKEAEENLVVRDDLGNAAESSSPSINESFMVENDPFTVAEERQKKELIDIERVRKVEDIYAKSSSILEKIIRK